MIRTFRQKLFMAFFGCSIFLAGSILGYIFWRLSDLPLQRTGDLLLTAVSNAAPDFNPDDIEALSKISNHEKLLNSSHYQKIHQALVRIEALPPKFESTRIQRLVAGKHGKGLYIVVPTDKPDVMRLLVALNPEYSGMEFNASEISIAKKAWLGPVVESRMDEDGDARGLAAYAPIFNREGHAIALFGMQMPGEYLEGIDQELIRSAIVVFFMAALLSVIPSIYFSGKLNRSLRLLKQNMDLAAEGNLEIRIPKLHTHDEFDALFSGFNHMLEGLQERGELKRSLEVARQIQQQLLPQSRPQLEGFEIYGTSDYCDETGGDYYDFLELSDIGKEMLGIAVGDVTGHGIGAALLMADVRGVIRSYANRFGEQLEELFHVVNRHLVRDTGEDRFMTLFYAVLDSPTRSLIWASAGHDPALLLRDQTGEIEELGNTGIPIGIMEGVSHQRKGPVKMQPGDVLLVGTDGIWEAANPQGERFGKDRLRKLLKEHHECSSSQITQKIVQAVHEFLAGGRHTDDITLIVVKAV